MENTPYSKREQDHFFGDLFKRMDKQDAILERIEGQTTKTNGRVSKLEWWQKAVIWGVGALWTFVIIAIPIAHKIFNNELKRQVSSIIDTKWTSLIGEYDQIIIDNNR